MSTELLVQSVTFLAGAGALASGLVGIARSLGLQRLLARKQAEGVHARRMKTDPEVGAAMRGLRRPLAWATALAVCALLAPPLMRLVLA